MDCLGNISNLVTTSKPPNYQCDKWCIDNNCGGYTVVGNTCYFKNESCKNNLFANEKITIYIPNGNYHKILYAKYITYRQSSYIMIKKLYLNLSINACKGNCCFLFIHNFFKFIIHQYQC